MKDAILKFEKFITTFQNEVAINPISNFDVKPSEAKWSKKEIIGHLIDSAINNIQRFTEIQYFEKPYKIRAYNPDELVKQNNYQNKNNQELFDLLINLNRHVIFLAKNQSETSLKFKMILPNNEIADLQFVIEDYFEHFYHHFKAIDACITVPN